MENIKLTEEQKQKNGQEILRLLKIENIKGKLISLYKVGTYLETHTKKETLKYIDNLYLMYKEEN